VPRRLAERMREAARIRLLDIPVDVPPLAEKLIWNPRFTQSQPHQWMRTLMAEIAATLRHLPDIRARPRAIRSTNTCHPYCQSPPSYPLPHDVRRHYVDIRQRGSPCCLRNSSRGA